MSVKVLFVCAHNSGRSQMAEAFFNHLAGGKGSAISAGVQPSDTVSPVVTKLMAEIGIDVSKQRTKALTPELLEGVTKSIIMGDDVDVTACPAAFAPTENWGLENPKGKGVEKERQIRDQIRAKVEELLRRL